jgi:hypothetical protein
MHETNEPIIPVCSADLSVFALYDLDDQARSEISQVNDSQNIGACVDHVSHAVSVNALGCLCVLVG